MPERLEFIELERGHVPYRGTIAPRFGEHDAALPRAGDGVERRYQKGDRPPLHLIIEGESRTVAGPLGSIDLDTNLDQMILFRVCVVMEQPKRLIADGLTDYSMSWPCLGRADNGGLPGVGSRRSSDAERLPVGSEKDAGERRARLAAGERRAHGMFTSVHAKAQLARKPDEFLPQIGIIRSVAKSSEGARKYRLR